MRALLISSCAPDATTDKQTGTTNWILRLTQLLASCHDVTLVTTSSVSDPWLKAGHVTVIEHSPDPIKKRIARIALSLARGIYPSMWLLYRPQTTSILQSIRIGQFDICWILEDYAGIYLRDIPDYLPVIFHRSYVLSMQKSFGKGLKGMFHKLTANAFDRWTTGRANLVLTGTQESCEFLRKRFPHNQVGYCPAKPCYLPVPTSPMNLSSSLRYDKRLLAVFLADMGFVRNADGARWFIDEVLPVMSEDLRNQYHFKFIGRQPNPCPSLHGLPPGSSVEFTGFVEDLTAALMVAQVAFIPVFGGNGVRIKTLTLLGTGLPTISTLDALEGLEVTDGQEVIIANDANSFAEAFKMLRNPSLRLKLHFRVLQYMGRFHAEEEDAELLLRHSQTTIASSSQ